MFQRVVSVLVIALAAGPALAQPGGGGHGRGGRNGPSSGGSTTSATASTPAPKPPKPTNQVVITGVVQAVDPAANQITIAYDAVDELNWPRGTMPFSAYKPELLKGVTVGQRVRFKLDSQQITELTPY